MEETLRMAQVGCGALREAPSGSDSGESAFHFFSHSVHGGRGRVRGPTVDSAIGFPRSNYWSAGIASKPAAAGLPRPASESTCQQPTEASSSGGLMP